jgi:hypothetical protein
VRYTLKDDGFPYRKIMQGRKWIGRTYKDAGGRYVGMIGKTEFKNASTHREAFEGVVALHCGHENIGAMRAINAAVRFERREVRAAGRYAADQLLRGNFEPFDRLLTNAFGKGRK